MTAFPGLLLGVLAVTVAGVLVLAFGALQAVWTVLAVLALAVLGALAVEPVVRAGVRCGLARGSSVGLVTVVVAVPSLVAAWFLVPLAGGQVVTWAGDIPWGAAPGWVDPAAVTGGFLAAGSSVQAGVSTFALVPVLAVYLSASPSVVRVVPAAWVGPLAGVAPVLGRLVAVRVLLAVVGGTGFGVLVAVLGGATPVAVGFLAGCAVLLPVVGVPLAGLVSVAACWAPVPAAIVLGFTLLGVFVERVLAQRWTPQVRRIPVVLLVLGPVVGAVLAGAWGTLLAAASLVLGHHLLQEFRCARS